MIVARDAEVREAIRHSRQIVQRAREICEGSRRVLAETAIVLARCQREDQADVGLSVRAARDVVRSAVLDTPGVLPLLT
jgi:hypothetical protein